MGTPSMLVLPDELLSEVFSRLPHAASVIRCSSVCKTWFSLIQQLNHQNHRHQDGGDYSDSSYSRPYTLLFKFKRTMTSRSRAIVSRFIVSGIYDSLDPTDDVLYTPYGPIHLRNSSHYLDFIPWELRLTDVVACGGDFLLVTTSSNWRQLYICNLVTRNCSPLPPCRHANNPSYGLAWDCRHRNQYRVVIASAISSYVDEVDEFGFMIYIFIPKTGEWISCFTMVPAALIPMGYQTIDCYPDAVACVGGILYFPTGSVKDEDKKITGILGIDPFHSEGPGKLQSRFVPLPAFFPANELRTKACFGEVRGRLRLSHSRLYNPMRVINLRIWELRDGGDEAPVPWRMIHHVHLPLNGVGRMLVPALHPNNGDVVFLLRDNDICSYNVRQNKYLKIGEIPDIQHPQSKDQLHLFLNVFTLVH